MAQTICDQTELNDSSLIDRLKIASSNVDNDKNIYEKNKHSGEAPLSNCKKKESFIVNRKSLKDMNKNCFSTQLKPNYTVDMIRHKF